MYYLDSCICIDLMRGKLSTAYEMMRNSDPRLFAVPAIVVSELMFGVEKSADIEKNRMRTENFLRPFQVVPFDESCAYECGRIRAVLANRGLNIGPNDSLIAATALAHQAVLVTNNDREFNRVPGLQTECWEEIEF